MRSIRWEFNWRLLVAGVLLFAVTSSAATVVYFFNEKKLDLALKEKAATAAAQGNREEQISWLFLASIRDNRSVNNAVLLAKAADEAASLDQEKSGASLARAMRCVNNAIILLTQESDSNSDLSPVEHLALEQDLLRRRIQLATQMGAKRAWQVLEDVVALNPPIKSPEFLRIFAQARYLQEMTSDDSKKTVVIEESANTEQLDWKTRLRQPLGDLFEEAWESNPKDIKLSGSLIELALNHTKLFSARDDNVDEFALMRLAERVARDLKTLENDGQACSVVLRYLRQVAPESVDAYLREISSRALERLDKNSQKNSEYAQKNVNSTETLSRETADKRDGIADYDPIWDFEIVLLSTLDPKSRLPIDADDSGGVDAVLSTLLRSYDDRVPEDLAELAFLQRGKVAWEASDQEKAWKIWIEGTQQLENSTLDLHKAIASTKVQFGEIDDARRAIANYEDAIRQQRIAAEKMRETRSGAKAERLTELSMGRWTLSLAKAELAIREERLADATNLLKEITNWQLPLPVEFKLRANILLAETFRKSGKKDLAALQFERASALDPQNMSLKTQAAEAWAQSGNPFASLREWNSVDSTSPDIALAHLRAKIAAEMTRPPSSRDFREAKRLLEVLRERAASIPDSKVEARIALESDIELLQLGIESPKKGVAGHSRREKLESICLRYPGNSDLQAMSAVTFAVAQDEKRLQSALNRLRASLGSDASDTLLLCKTLAQVEVQKNKSSAAIRRLEEFAAKHPDLAGESLSMAANIAAKDGKPAEAYRLLNEVPDTSLTPSILYRIFSLALEGIEVTGSAQDPDASLDLAKQWEQRILEIEGEAGGWWKLAKINLLLKQATELEPFAVTSEDLLQSANKLQSELVQARPMWAPARVAEGRVSKALGLNRKSIDAFRRAIACGDNSVGTVMLLVSLLTQENRIIEAEAELGRLDAASSSNVLIDSLATQLAVDIAKQSRDYDQVLERFRESAAKDPNSVEARLGVARFAILSAEQPDVGESEKESFVTEAEASLNQAIELSSNKMLEPYFLLLQLHSRLSNKKASQDVLARVAASSISEPAKSLFIAKAYLSLGETDLAEPLLAKLKQTFPKSPDVFATLSIYHRQKSDPKSALKSLEQALELAPDRRDLKNALALALYLKAGKSVPWTRISELLGQSANPKDRLTFALMLINQGRDSAWSRAEEILREELNLASDNRDASRLLASLLQLRWAAASRRDSPKAQNFLDESIAIRESLKQKQDATISDLANYANLMLMTERDWDPEAVCERIDAKSEQANLIPLKLRLEVLKKEERENEASATIASWARDASQKNQCPETDALIAAGRLASSLGFHEQAVKILKEAYLENKETLPLYIGALQRANKTDTALSICEEQFARDQSTTALTLMAMLYTSSEEKSDLPESIENIIAQTLSDQVSVNESLLIAIATLAGTQNRIREADELFQKAEAINPNNIRLLNNHALLLVNIENREEEALEKLRRAINLAGRDANLLDSMATVLLKMGETEEAISNLREASASSNNPLFLFHLVAALADNGRIQEARELWQKLDKQALEDAALPPTEREALKSLQAKMGSYESVRIESERRRVPLIQFSNFITTVTNDSAA